MIFDLAQSGPLRGTDGDDTLTATVQNGFGQIHVHAGAGDDLINLDFNVITKYSYGHHARGDEDGSLDRGADVFNFTNLQDIRGFVVGRIEDFQPDEDLLAIEGSALSLEDLKSGSGNNAGYNWRIVEYDADPDDSALGPQQWLLIDTGPGFVMYALEGARVTDGDGASNDFNDDGVKNGEQEAHFVGAYGSDRITRADLAELEVVRFEEEVNFVPSDATARGGVKINDYDATIADAFAPIEGTAAGDLIAAGLNDDSVLAGGGDDQVWGGSGDDRLFGGHGRDTVEGGGGDDRIDGGRHDDHLDGGAGADTIAGGKGADLIAGGLDEDQLSGGRGDDLIAGDTGNDTLRGGEGRDTLEGGGGDDLLRGGRGEDSLLGDKGADRLLGRSGNDTLEGHRGADRLDGGRGDDRMFGNRHDDTLSGGQGDDYIDGARDDDVVSGNRGNDTLLGGRGDDTLKGGHGRDMVEGGKGDDRIIGGSEADTITGGAGSDTFVVQQGHLVDWDDLEGDKLSQTDVITDFKMGEDQLVFDNVEGAGSIADLSGSHVEIDGNPYLLVRVTETNERLLVAVEEDDEDDWAALFDRPEEEWMETDELDQEAEDAEPILFV